MADNTTAAAEFLSLARTDPDLREALSAAVVDSRRAEQALLETSVSLARERGVELSVDELRVELERELGFEERWLADDSDGGAGKCKSGCRTPCLYCKKPEEEVVSPILDEDGGF